MQRPGRVLGGVRPTGEDDRVTTFGVGLRPRPCGCRHPGQRLGWPTRTAATAWPRAAAAGAVVVDLVGLCSAGQPGRPLVPGCSPWSAGTPAAPWTWWPRPSACGGCTRSASLAAEHRLAEAYGRARVRLAVAADTYGHLPIVAGIVLAAVGMEGVLAHAGDTTQALLWGGTVGRGGAVSGRVPGRQRHTASWACHRWPVWPL